MGDSYVGVVENLDHVKEVLEVSARNAIRLAASLGGQPTTVFEELVSHISEATTEFAFRETVASDLISVDTPERRLVLISVFMLLGAGGADALAEDIGKIIEHLKAKEAADGGTSGGAV